MTEPLTYHEAEEIFQEMQSHTDKSDPDIAGIYDNLKRKKWKRTADEPACTMHLLHR